MTPRTTDYTITKHGRRWAVIEIATDEAQVYLDTKRAAERWVERWVANAAEEAEYQAAARERRIARVREWQAERAARTAAQPRLI